MSDVRRGLQDRTPRLPTVTPLSQGDLVRHPSPDDPPPSLPLPWSWRSLSQRRGPAERPAVLSGHPSSTLTLRETPFAFLLGGRVALTGRGEKSPAFEGQLQSQVLGKLDNSDVYCKMLFCFAIASIFLELVN